MDKPRTAVAWRDPHKYAWPLALLVPTLPFTGFVVWRAADGAAWAWWITPVAVFGLVPALDMVRGDDRTMSSAGTRPKTATGVIHQAQAAPPVARQTTKPVNGSVGTSRASGQAYL